MSIDESKEKYCAVAVVNVPLCCSSVADRIAASGAVETFERALIARPADWSSFATSCA